MDKAVIEELLNNFVSSAHPSNSDSCAPATVGDINNVISATVALVNGIINELD